MTLIATLECKQLFYRRVAECIVVDIPSDNLPSPPSFAKSNDNMDLVLNLGIDIPGYRKGSRPPGVPLQEGIMTAAFVAKSKDSQPETAYLSWNTEGGMTVGGYTPYALVPSPEPT